MALSSSDLVKKFYIYRTAFLKTHIYKTPMNWQDLDIFTALDNTQGLILVGFLFVAFLLGIFTHWLFVRPRLRRLRQENRKLQKDLKVAQEQYRELKEHYTVQEANLKRLNSEKKEQTQQLLLAENEQKQLAQRIDSQSAELRQYKRLKESAEAELVDFKSAFRALESDKQGMEKELARLQAAQGAVDTRIAAKDKELADLREEQTQLEEELQLAKDSLQITKEQLLDLQQHAAALEEELQNSKAKAQELDDKQVALNAAQAQIESLEAQLRTTQNRLSPYLQAEENAQQQAQQEEQQMANALSMAQAALEKFGLFQAIPATMLEESPEKIAAAINAPIEESAALDIDDTPLFEASEAESANMQQTYETVSELLFDHPFYAASEPKLEQEQLEALRSTPSDEKEWSEEEEDYDQSFAQREETAKEEGEASTDAPKEEESSEEESQDWSADRFARALEQADALAQNSPLFGGIEEAELVEDASEISRNLEEDAAYFQEQEARGLQEEAQPQVELSEEEAQHLSRSLEAIELVMRNNPFFDEMDAEALQEKLFNQEQVDLEAINQLKTEFEEKGQLSRALYSAEDLAQRSLLFQDLDAEQLIEDKEQVSRNLEEDLSRQARSVAQTTPELSQEEKAQLEERLAEMDYFLKDSPLFDDEVFEQEAFYQEEQKDLERVEQIAQRIEEEGAFYGKEQLAARALENSPLFGDIDPQELIANEEQISRSLREDEAWMQSQEATGRGMTEESEESVVISEEELAQMQAQLQDLEGRWEELFDEKGLLEADVYQADALNEEAIEAIGRGFQEEDQLQRQLLEAEKYAQSSLLFDHFEEMEEPVEDAELLARRLAEEQPEAPQGRSVEAQEVELNEEERAQLDKRLEQVAYYLTYSPLFGTPEEVLSESDKQAPPNYLSDAEERLQQALLQDVPPGQKEQPDDLQAINGIGTLIEKRLNDLGIFNYHQIAAFEAPFIEILAEVMGISAETIQRDDWCGQAQRLIADGA